MTKRQAETVREGDRVSYQGLVCRVAGIVPVKTNVAMRGPQGHVSFKTQVIQFILDELGWNQRISYKECKR